jgi:hypothetical protein
LLRERRESHHRVGQLPERDRAGEDDDVVVGVGRGAEGGGGERGRAAGSTRAWPSTETTTTRGGAIGRRARRVRIASRVVKPTAS